MSPPYDEGEIRFLARVSQRVFRSCSNWIIEGGAVVGEEAAKGVETLIKAAHGAAANIRALALARLRMPSTCCCLACVAGP